MSLLDPHMLLHLIVRGFDLATMVIVVGGFAFESFVAAPAFDRLSGPSQKTATLAFRRRYTRLIGWSLAALLIIQGIDLVFRVQMMSGRPVSAVLGLIPQAAVGTHVGKVWLAKMAVLVGLLIIWLFVLGTGTPAPPRTTRHRRALLAGAALFCLLVALAGHAADRGNVSLDVAADWLHVMAVSAWVGGLISLRALLPAALDRLDEKTAARVFTDALGRFSTVAGVCLAILLSTGVYHVLIHIHTWDGLSSPYGLALLVKLAFVAPMIALGALGRYAILPELRALTGERVRLRGFARLANASIASVRRMINRHSSTLAEAGERTAVERRGLRLILFECLLAAGVLACTAILTQTMPPHVTGFHAPGAMPHDMSDMPGTPIR